MEREFLRVLQRFKGEIERTFITDKKLEHALTMFKYKLDSERYERKIKIMVVVGCLALGFLWGALFIGGWWHSKYNEAKVEIAHLQEQIQIQTKEQK